MHGPILLELDFESNEHAVIIEQLLPSSVVSMYITENENDRDILMKTDGVNVFNVSPDSLSAPRRTFDLSKYAKNGLHAYADQLIKANPVVREAICRYANLDKIIVGDASADKAVDEGLFGKKMHFRPP